MQMAAILSQKLTAASNPEHSVPLTNNSRPTITACFLKYGKTEWEKLAVAEVGSDKGERN
jgi:hypothetical protein